MSVLLTQACTSLESRSGELQISPEHVEATLAGLQGQWTLESQTGTRRLEFDQIVAVESSYYLLGHDESLLPIFARVNASKRRIDVRGSEFFRTPSDEIPASDAIAGAVKARSALLPFLTANYFDITDLSGDNVTGFEVTEAGEAGPVRGSVHSREMTPHPSIALSRSVSVEDGCVVRIQIESETMSRMGKAGASLQISDLAFLNDFYAVFSDDFDFIILVPDIPPSQEVESTSRSQFLPFQVQDFGLGRPVSKKDSALRGVIVLADNSGIALSPLLHELAHGWANSFSEISGNGHWGTSDVNGVLGGVDVGGQSAPLGLASNTAPYAPLELYLMGLLPADEVPDILLQGGARITINDLVGRYGARVPDVAHSPKAFRAAVVIVGPEQPDALTVHRNCQDARWFSLERADRYSGIFNFWEATGGRASIDADHPLDARIP